MLKVEFKGGKELEAALKELTPATAKNVTRRAARKVLKPFADRANELAPVKTGKLSKSYNVGGRPTRGAKANMTRETRTSITVLAGSADPAAIQEEFGMRQAAHPHARPAWDETSPKMVPAFGDEMWTEIEKAAERARKKALKTAKG